MIALKIDFLVWSRFPLGILPRQIFFLRRLQDGDRLTFSAEKRKHLVKQFEYWLDSNQFSAASL